MNGRFLSIDITPTHPVPLCGYAARQGSFRRIDAPLEANLALFTDQSGLPVVLGSVDTLFVGDAVADRLARDTGIPRERLILVATHTHNAPSLAPQVHRLGRFDPSYGAMAGDRMAAAIRRLMKEAPSALKIAHAERKVPLNVNRRRRALLLDYYALVKEKRLSFSRAIALAPNREGVIDPMLRCIVLRNGTGMVRAVIWSFACHPAFYPFERHVSPDFPGLVRVALRKVFGEGCVVLYLPGLAGSAMPDIPPRAPRTLRQAIVMALPFKPNLPNFTPATYRDWSAALSAEVTACVREAREVEPETTVIRRCARSADIFVSRDKTMPNIDLSLVGLDVGKACGVVAMTGEVVGEWGPILASMIGGRRMATGYLSGPCLYVPTGGVVEEGGYEADRFRASFGLSGSFVPGLDHVVGRAVMELFSPTVRRQEERLYGNR